jgi:AraC-like DNA-binding protein
MSHNQDSDLAVSTLPTIISFGRSTFDAVWAEKEHTNTVSELLHILHGNVEVKTRNYTIKGSKGDTIYTPAFSPHRDIFSTDTPFEVHLFQFFWPDEKKMLKRYTPTQLASIQKSDKRKIAADIHNLYQTLIQGTSLGRELSNSMLLTIILRLFQAADTASGVEPAVPGKSSKEVIMEEAKKLIQKEYSRPVSLDEIASALNISAYYLSHIFSQESGFTLSSHLTEVRMQNAALLLTSTQSSIASIAQSVGFSDATYFRKVFKLHYGISPREYRTRTILETK